MVLSIWGGVSLQCGITRVILVGCIADVLVAVAVGKSLASYLAGLFSYRSLNSIFVTSILRDFRI